MKKNAIVMAAGKGTRMKSDRPKVVQNVLYKPIVSHIVDALKKADIENIVVVVGYKAEEVEKVLENENVKFVYQTEQLGTGHAVLQAAPVLENEDGITVVINGDAPLITEQTISDFIDQHIADKNDITAMTIDLDPSYHFGRIIRSSDGSIERNVEYKDASEEIRKITEMNAGFYCGDNKKLFELLKEVKNDNVQKEYYITDIIELGNKHSYKVGGYKALSIDEIGGINDRVELAKANTAMRKRINHQHLINGVEIIDPDNTYIGVDVIIGPETVIEPGCLIKGKTVIGSNCFIGAHTKLENVTIGNNVTILDSYITDSVLDDGVEFGPYSRLRSNCHIRSNVHIGNFVEMKATDFGETSKCSHFTYLGDSVVGKDVNIGCGTFTANYDGKNKSKTFIGDHSFIGCNTVMVAPAKIGKDAFTAAGSVITEEVPDNALAIARSRQVNKENYISKIIEKRENKK